MHVWRSECPVPGLCRFHPDQTNDHKPQSSPRPTPIVDTTVRRHEGRNIFPLNRYPEWLEQRMLN